jgi:hypothetical protein
MIINSRIIRYALFLSFVTVFSVMPVAGETFSFQNDEFTINADYNKSAHPGEAVFVHMILKSTKKRSKPNQENAAVLELFCNEKKIDSSCFFLTNPKSKKQNYADMTAGIPLSLYLSPKDTYVLKIIFTAAGIEAKEFLLPLSLETMTKCTEENLKLNKSNTDIKNDTSPERLAQIKKLNTILETVLPSDVYTLQPFNTPVPLNTQRSSNFGDRRVYICSTGKKITVLHNGIDYVVPEGTSVFSCGEGRVVMAEQRISTGWSVVIEHNPGLYSLYYHMKSLNIKEGQMVRPHEKIGISGSTGLSTGPHLHWEIRLNSAAVSPDFFTQNYAFTRN